MARRTKEEVSRERAMVARIHASLDQSVAAVERAMVLLYERQTAAEQATETTTEHNGVGFSANDATIATRIVKNVILKATAAGVRPGKRLWGTSLAISRRIAHRYASTQLLDAALAKMEAEDAARVAAMEDERDGELAYGRRVEDREYNREEDWERREARERSWEMAS
jgi:hypothetical protein